MYRRIEIIYEYNDSGDHSKGGLTALAHSQEAMDAWWYTLRGVGTGKNNRYFFTEKGWREVGRFVVKGLLRGGDRFRVITVKERSVDVMAGDDLEVAVRFRKKNLKG